MSFSILEEANSYIDVYFKILTIFYNQNKLLLNPEKTNLLIIANPSVRNQKIEIKTDSETVTPKKQIRILGFETNNRNSMDTHLRETVAKTKQMMARMNNIKKYMTEKQRLQFANSFMISKLQYGAQFLASEKVQIRREYHAATMSIARWVREGFIKKKKKIWVFSRLGLTPPPYSGKYPRYFFEHTGMYNARNYSKFW